MSVIPHFIRPNYLLLLLPVWIYLAWIMRRQIQFNPWRSICDAHLLAALIRQPKRASRRSYYSALWVFFSLSIIACAGPAWYRAALPIYRQSGAVMLVLELSAAMQEKDLQPDRLTRATFKIRDLINAAKTTQMGLVVYSAEAFTVSPLSADAATLNALLEELSPAIMPIAGADAGTGLQLGSTLLKQAGILRGNLLLISASPPTTESLRVAKAIAQQGGHVSIMGAFGNNTNNQQLILQLQELAHIGNGNYYPFATDAETIIKVLNASAPQQIMQADAANAYLWVDAGPWLCLLILPFAGIILREKMRHENEK